MVWRDSVGVEGSGSELKIRVRGYFSSECFSGCCSILQGHPTTVFGEISVRSPLEWLKFSGAQEQLKISKMFRGDCSLGSEFRDLCGLFT